MALPTVEEIIEYLRLDEVEEEEKSFLDSLILVAQEDLADSGIKNQETERYGLAIKLLVANHYEQRRPQVVGTITTKLSYSLERLILQLKAAELPKGDES